MRFIQLTFSVACLLTTLACGDSSGQPEARDSAATAVCDRFAACGEIGSGKRYETRGSCDVDQKANWEKLWPPATCDGHIDPDKLDVCLTSIDTAECNNGLDVLNILVNKCPKEKVCSK